MTPLIKPDDYTTLWALIILGTGAAIWLEQKYKWAARLSGPVIALLISMALSNTGIVPSESPAYDFVGTWLIPLAIPLLLFRANVVQIFRTTGRLFICFHISSVGSILGTGLAIAALRGRIQSPGLEQAGGIMAASYVGGSVNFFAVAQNYRVPGNITNPLIVADNFVMAGAFVVLLSLATSPFFRKRYPHPHTLEASSSAAENVAAHHWQRKGISLLDIAKSLSFAFVVVGLAALLGRGAQSLFSPGPGSGMLFQMLQTLCTNKYVLLTATSLVLATLLHKPLKEVNGPDEIGIYLLYLFLFVIGLPADLRTVLLQAPLFFLFCGIIAVVNLCFTLVIGKIFKLPLEELLLSVNANLGGAPSAAAMAISCGWSRLVLPGILIGIWGYVIGTPIGIMVVEFFKR